MVYMSCLVCLNHLWVEHQYDHKVTGVLESNTRKGQGICQGWYTVLCPYQLTLLEVTQDAAMSRSGSILYYFILGEFKCFSKVRFYKSG